jgi:hypothetical protein
MVGDGVDALTFSSQTDMSSLYGGETSSETADARDATASRVVVSFMVDGVELTGDFAKDELYDQTK